MQIEHNLLKEENEALKKQLTVFKKLLSLLGIEDHMIKPLK